MKSWKNTTKILSIILAVTLIFSLAPLTLASAAGAFSDVSETDYYYNEVTTMYSQGVVNGYGGGQFLPKNPVTNAEAMKLICSMAGVSYSGYSGKTDPWYSDVWAWALDHGIMTSSTVATANTTREQLAGYIVAVYKLPTTTTTSAFSDSSSKAANVLYDYGIVKGVANSDGTFSFNGSANVIRGDTCIMLYRLSQKVSKPNWSSSVTLNKTHYAVSKPTSFQTYDDFVNTWKYMLVNTVYSADYKMTITCSSADLDGICTKIQNAYIFAALDYMEFYSFLNQWEVGASGSVNAAGNYVNPTFTLKLSSGMGLSNDETSREITEFKRTCETAVTKMFTDGTLKTNMTIKEKALVLYKYVDYNVKYDTTYKYYNGYNAAVGGNAVCQGYSAMYNYLCNLAGVKMEGMMGYVGKDGHAWSRIYDGGAYYNCDTTWGDAVPDVPNTSDETFFWVSDTFLKTYSTPRTFDIDTLVYGQ